MNSNLHNVTDNYLFKKEDINKKLIDLHQLYLKLIEKKEHK